MRFVELPAEAPASFREKYPEYHPAIVQLLYNRHLTDQVEIEDFLNPEYHHLHDPYLFKDMVKAVDRIFDAIEKSERIAIHGDYDADGVSGSVILQSVLDTLGARTMVFLPHREKDGYGLNAKTVEYLTGEGATLLITCDCGISNKDEIGLAKSKGIDTIITDHHQIPEQLPDAFAIIHPKIADETYPFKFLAGGGVAFKLAQGLLRSKKCGLTERDCESQEKWLLDLVAVSSVADMVELVGENRVLVKFGLLVLAKTRRIGLQNLIREARIREKRFTTQTIAFQIAPRINAAGRMDHANSAYMLLRATEAAEAARLAKLLESQNKNRQTTTDRMYREARELLGESEGRPFSIIFKREWPAGLTGLLAGKITKDTGKPTFVMGYDGERIVGSGRSPDGYSIMNALKAVRHLMLSFGGHPQACGFRFEEKRLSEVTSLLYDYGSKNRPNGTTVSGSRAEAAIGFPALTWEFIDQVQRFEPFGQANPEPVFASENVTVTEVKRVGKKLNHLKFIFESEGVSRNAIAFDYARMIPSVGSSGTVLYTVLVNEWNGNRDIQLNVKQFIPYGAA